MSQFQGRQDQPQFQSVTWKDGVSSGKNPLRPERWWSICLPGRDICSIQGEMPAMPGSHSTGGLHSGRAYQFPRQVVGLQNNVRASYNTINQNVSMLKNVSQVQKASWVCVEWGRAQRACALSTSQRASLGPPSLLFVDIFVSKIYIRLLIKVPDLPTSLTYLTDLTTYLTLHWIG